MGVRAGVKSLEAANDLGGKISRFIPIHCEDQRKFNLESITNRLLNSMTEEARIQIELLKKDKNHVCILKNSISEFKEVLITKTQNNHLDENCKSLLINALDSSLTAEIEKGESIRKSLDNVASFVLEPENYLSGVISSLISQTKNADLDNKSEIDRFKIQMKELITFGDSISKSSLFLMKIAKDLIRNLVDLEKNHKIIVIQHSNMKNLQRFFAESISFIFDIISKKSEIEVRNAFQLGIVYFKFHINSIINPKFVQQMKNFYEQLVKEQFTYSEVRMKSNIEIYYKLKTINTVTLLANDNIITTKNKREFLSNFSSYIQVNFEYYKFLDLVNKLFSHQDIVDLELIPDLFIAGMVKAINFLSVGDITKLSIKNFPQSFEDFLRNSNKEDRFFSRDYIPILRIFNFLLNEGKVKPMIFNNLDLEISEQTIQILQKPGCSQLYKVLQYLQVVNKEKLDQISLSKSRSSRQGSEFSISQPKENNEDTTREQDERNLISSQLFFDHLLGASKKTTNSVQLDKSFSFSLI